jgi:hypothetical protein
MDLRHLLCSTASTAPITQEGSKEPTFSLQTPHATSPASQPSSIHQDSEPIRRVTFAQNENLDSIGTSTWQSRNPMNNVLLPRIRSSLRMTDAGKASAAARSLKRKEKSTDLEEAIHAIIDNRDYAIQELAKVHSVSVKSLATRVNATSNYHSTRSPNIFNALVSLSSVELNEGQFMFSHCWDLLIIVKVVTKGTA